MVKNEEDILTLQKNERVIGGSLVLLQAWTPQDSCTGVIDLFLPNNDGYSAINLEAEIDLDNFNQYRLKTRD